MKTGEQAAKNKSSETQNALADKSGLAIIVVDENSSVLSESNNNSICRVLYNSEEFAPECDKYCGRAFEWATSAEKPVGYKCYAGLNCLAVPMKNEEEKETVAIIGRAFTKAEDYRSATARAISGDWSKFSPSEFFENVLLTNSEENLEKLAARLKREQEKTDKPITKPSAVDFAEVESREPKIESETESEISDFKLQNELEDDENILEIEDETVSENQSVSEEPITNDEQTESNIELEKVVEEQTVSGERQSANNQEQPTTDNEQLTTDGDRTNPQSAIRNPKSAWRSLFGSLLDLSYRQACRAVLQFIKQRYKIENLAWLERETNRLEIIFAEGNFRDREMQFNFAADDRYLLDAVRNETSLELRERQTKDATEPPQTIRLFPVAVGEQVWSALIVGDEISDEKPIVRLCAAVAAQLEILRLREKLAKREFVENALARFNESLRDIDSDDFWSRLINVSAELMQAERTSLLVFDEKSDAFTAKAATGIRADFIQTATENLGERVAKNVLSDGEAIVVEDVNKIGLQAAPADWLYKSDSFISYPIAIGKRKIGVLNLTDKADGDRYGTFDLELLSAIMPSLAVMIDRADLKNKAGEYEQLSVTDALTGLLNRRYLEERLTEEVKRSNRHGFPMSFLMIDVDEFKSYNDAFGHTEGDKALKIVGGALKETLRGADVAARYGGEEFSILLPQTNSFEAATIAERVRERVEQTEFPNRRVTVSIGIASCSTNLDSAKKLISAADKALYAAKRRGRNNVRIYENLESENGATELVK